MVYKFLREVYFPSSSEIIIKEVQGRSHKLETVAAYVRLILSIIGTLLPLIGGLELFGVPIIEWLSTLSETVCVE